MKTRHAWLATMLVVLMMTSCRTEHEPYAPIDPVEPATLYAVIDGWRDGEQATNDGPVTRVGYQDAADYLSCQWQIGDKIDFTKDGEETPTAQFEMTEIDANDVATLKLRSGSFEGANGGTFAYNPGSGSANRQTANGSTDHLKYGETLRTTGTDYKAYLSFTHEQSAVYKLVFHAPEAWTAGEATIGIIGLWPNNDAFLTLDFAATQGEVITAYLIHSGGSLAAGSTLLYTLDVRDHEYTIALTPAAGVAYANGCFWTADLMDKTEGTPRWKTNEGTVCGNLQWAKKNVGAETVFEKGSLLYLSSVPTSDGWRLPTKDEMETLSACQWRWTTCYKGHKVPGYIVSGATSGKRGQYIFLPETGKEENEQQVNTNGYYWTSTPLTNDPADSRYHALMLQSGNGTAWTSNLDDSQYAARLVKVTQ